MLSWRHALVTLCFLGIACGDEDTQTPRFTVNFAAQAGDNTIECGVSYTDVGMSTTTVRVKDFKVFVSNIRLLNGDEEVPLALDQSNIWQYDQVALLDFEDGSSTCSETGNELKNSVVTGTADIDNVTGISFDIGVPFELNHFEPTTQPSPLNIPSMFWNWRGGYKFVRIDLDTDHPASEKSYNIHLGSTACVSDSPTAPPNALCGRSNRPSIQLPGFNPDTNVVVFDLQGLMNSVVTSTNTEGSPPGCQSFPIEPTDCTTVFQNLGLSFETGSCDGNCSGQRFVRML